MDDDEEGAVAADLHNDNYATVYLSHDKNYAAGYLSPKSPVGFPFHLSFASFLLGEPEEMNRGYRVSSTLFWNGGRKELG